MIKPASEKQIAFATRLFAERNHEMPDTALAVYVDAGSRAVSSLIDRLLALPNKPRPTAVTEHAPADTDMQTGEGIYVLDGNVVKVVKARSTGNLYAKRLVVSAPRVTADGVEVDADFVYAPGVIARLTPAMKMTVDEARAFAVQHGICANCGRKLKAAKSVEAGIGPVCIKKFAPVAAFEMAGVGA